MGKSARTAKVAAKQSKEQFDEMLEQYNHVSFLLAVLVKAAGGRISVDKRHFTELGEAAMAQGPQATRIHSFEHGDTLVLRNDMSLDEEMRDDGGDPHDAPVVSGEDVEREAEIDVYRDRHRDSGGADEPDPEDGGGSRSEEGAHAEDTGGIIAGAGLDSLDS